MNRVPIERESAALVVLLSRVLLGSVGAGFG